MNKDTPRMTTQTAKWYGLKTLASPFMVLLLAFIVYFAYLSFGNPDFVELFIVLIIIFILWPLLNVVSVSKKHVTLTDNDIIITYDKPGKDDKIIPLDAIKTITVKHSVIGSLFTFQDIIIMTKTDEIDIITGISDGDMLVNMVKQIAEEKKREADKKESEETPIKEADFNFTNHT